MFNLTIKGMKTSKQDTTFLIADWQNLKDHEGGKKLALSLVGYKFGPPRRSQLWQR